jgi:hypothetical protein
VATPYLHPRQPSPSSDHYCGGGVVEEPGALGELLPEELLPDELPEPEEPNELPDPNELPEPDELPGPEDPPMPLPIPEADPSEVASVLDVIPPPNRLAFAYNCSIRGS